MDDVTMMVVAFQKMRTEGRVFNEFEYLLYEKLSCVLTLRLDHDLKQIKQAIEGMKKEPDENKRPEDPDALGAAQPA